MGLLMYAVSDCPPEALPAGDAELRCVGEGSLAAIVGEHDGGAVQPGEEALWRYEQIVEQLMSEHTVLPARFGSVFEDEASIRTMLRDRREDLSDALERVRGAVELGIRSNWTDPAQVLAEPQHRTGTSYMLGRLELQRRARALARQLDELEQLSRISRRRVLPHPKLPLLGAYLVDCGRVPQFAERVERIDDDLEDVELVCTGPWPPYSFVEGVLA